MNSRFASIVKSFGKVYWNFFYWAARGTALLMMVSSVIGAVVLSLDSKSKMEAPLRWGLVGILTVIAIICFFALRAPIRRRGATSLRP